MNKVTNKKILIIGNEGYIGSLLFQKLQADFSVDGIDTCWFGNRNTITLKLDYKDLTETQLSCYDVIILLAAHSSVKMCLGNPIFSHNNNVNNFLELISKLENIKNSKRIKLIYASSSSVYGNTKEKPYDESSIVFKPHNNYDSTKFINDIYAELSSVEFYGLRFGTVNGFSPVVRNDVMINSMLSSAFKNGHIKLYNKDIFRPILGTNDLYRAIKAIIDSDEDNRGIYNLASFNTNSGDIAKSVSLMVGVEIIEIDTHDENNKNTLYNFSIDSDKFKNTFDFNFNETVDSIVSGIIENKSTLIETNRNEVISYEL